jgi:hypothetical protein
MNRTFQLCTKVLLLLFLIDSAWAAPVDVLSVNMAGLIDRAAGQPERFAAGIPHTVNISKNGAWSGGASLTRVWSYSVQVPTAVSLSFHAWQAVFPPSAVLTVTGSKASVTYRARDLGRGELWSRPLVGDTLTVSLSVAASDAGLVQLQIDSVQAGYRSLGGGVPDHPYFARLKSIRAAAATQSCTENYSCHANSSSQGPANATVAVVIANEYQCTGTLINNTRNDFTPYVLTARHCQNGELGGGAPQAASSITVYWDAVTACGPALGSIYDGTARSQSGATTVVEQQDAWLVKLDDAPVASDAFWAGWDATGSAFTGGYSVHHALGFNKQYVSWYGQAFAQTISAKTLSIGYDSSLWGVVNQVGSVGSGASGGALFDPNNRLVGSATFAALQNGENSPGVCPATPPSTPAADTVTAQYTSLAAVFASTADSTSTTGTVTLQSILDPINTGQLTNDGAGTIPVTLNASTTSPTTFQTLTLTWNVAGAQSCTASGGVSGDGWAGAKPISGSTTINNYTGGQINYTLTCSSGNSSGTSTVSVSWFKVITYISLVNGNPGPVMIGGSVFLEWSPNVTPCVARGGVSGDGWAGSKAGSGFQSQNLTATQLGTVTYSMTCGTGPQAVTEQVTVTVVPLAVTMTSNATQLRVGSEASLNWIGAGSGDSCSTSGGGSGDGWASQTNQGTTQMEYISETTPGTYTYTITCTGGGQTVTQSQTVVFTNDSPMVSLTAVSPTQQIYPQLVPITPPVDLQWSSNVSGCFLSAMGPEGNTSVTLNGTYPSGTASDAEFMAGAYIYQLQCGQYQATAAIQWTTSTPKLTLTAPTTTWVANDSYPISWSTNTEPCTQTGGSPGDGWAGNYSPGQAQQTVTETQPGNYTFTLTCGTGSSRGQAQLNVTVPPPAVTISATPTSVGQYSVIQLSWNSSVAPCTAVVPGAVNWGGSSVSPGGSIPVIESATGTFTYAISCGSGSSTVQASTQVTVANSTPTSLTATSSTSVVNVPVNLTWSSASGDVCTASGGTGSDGWTGTLVSSGSTRVTSPTAGMVTYGITCSNTGIVTTQVTYTAPTGTLTENLSPSVQLSTNDATQSVGQGVMLTWSSQNAANCVASGGAAGDGWTGGLPVSGSMQVVEQQTGTVTYGIECTGVTPASKAQVNIDFTNGSTSGTSGTSGSGGAASHGSGGGSIDRVLLWFLGLTLLAVGRRRLVGPALPE